MSAFCNYKNVYGYCTFKEGFFRTKRCRWADYSWEEEDWVCRRPDTMGCKHPNPTGADMCTNPGNAGPVIAY